MIDKKVNYMHDNLIEAGFVEKPLEYLNSSARDYAEIRGLVKVIAA